MFENIVTFKINPWVNTGTIARLIEKSVLAGDADILTDISEVDILIGAGIYINAQPISFIPLEEVKGSVEKLREMLISANIAQETEIYNFHSCLDFLSGSAGYLRSYAVVQKFGKNDLDALVYALQFHKEQNMENLNIGMRLDENYKSGDIMNLQVKNILKKYYAFEQTNEKITENDAIIKIIPRWFWIQEIRSSK